MFTNAEKQALLSLKEENIKFLKKHESNKKYISKEKVKEFMENLNQKIDNIIVENRNQKALAAGLLLHKKRKISEILPNNGNKNKAPTRPRIEQPIVAKNSLDNFIKNPGLQHLAENIFLYLGYTDLKACQLINQSSQVIFNNPRFWLKKFIQGGMSKKNQNDWNTAIQLAKNTNFERNLKLYLKRSLCKGKMMDIPCYIDENTLQKSYTNLIKKLELIIDTMLLHENDNVLEDFSPGCLQALVGTMPFVVGTSGKKYSKWPLIMRLFAQYGRINCMKAITPLLSKPNAPLRSSEPYDMRTPIHSASLFGCLEIIKFLGPLSDNLTVEALQSAINLADTAGHNDIVKYLTATYY